MKIAPFHITSRVCNGRPETEEAGRRGVGSGKGGGKGRGRRKVIKDPKGGLKKGKIESGPPCGRG